jgi:Trypsin-co-occurring domain 2
VAEPISKGVVGLADAIGALRDELVRAWSSSQQQRLRFKPAPVELTMQAAVTSSGTGWAGIRWWLVELGGEVSRESVMTQTLAAAARPVAIRHHNRAAVTDRDFKANVNRCSYVCQGLLLGHLEVASLGC